MTESGRSGIREKFQSRETEKRLSEECYECGKSRKTVTGDVSEK